MIISPFSDDFLGYRVFNGDITHLISDLSNRLQIEDTGYTVLTLNPHSYATSLNDPLFSDALHNSDILIPDGIGIVLASKFLKGKIRGRITGSDLFYNVCKLLNNTGNYSVFFLGSSNYVLQKIEKKIRSQYPNIRYLGHYSPPFTDEFSSLESNRIISLINSLKPDVLWVGLTAPKQEKWIFNFSSILNVKIICGVGAVFDFYSGNIARPNPFFIFFNLEWFIRLCKNPRRLWRRTFISGLIFLKTIAISKINKTINKIHIHD